MHRTFLIGLFLAAAFIAFSFVPCVFGQENPVKQIAPATKPGTVGKVASSAADVMPIAVGEKVPEATLKKVDGSKYELTAEVKKQPTVLIFYRGGWCPFCNQQMSGLQGIVKDLHDSGYQLLAISPDLPANLAKSVEKHTLTYTLLSDTDSAASKAFGVAFKVDDKVVDRMKKMGADLDKATGASEHVLPVPAVFILGTDGTIRYVHYDPDYKKRMDPKEILKQAKLALQK